MYYGNLENNKLQRPFRRYYSSICNVEIDYELATNKVNFTTFVGGDAYTAPLVLRSDGDAANYFYFHRDFLGSILAITNGEGDIIEKRHFDAWGNIVFIKDRNNNNLQSLQFTDRGYTGHEHIEGAGLINMNARLYDPKTHRFLQADKYIQDPFNTQNYNRYTYCLNNPLKYTDVTGNFIDAGVGILIGIGVALAGYFANAIINDIPITVDGIMTTIIFSGFSSALSFGIGEIATSISNLAVRTGFQALAHGGSQGGLTHIQGGKFWSGFSAGSISSIAATLYGGSGYVDSKGNFVQQTVGLNGVIGGGGAGMIAFGTIAGGVSASLTKGNFWQGALSGFAVSMMNHMEHDGQSNMDEGEQVNSAEDKIRNILKSTKFNSEVKNISDFESVIGSSEMKFVKSIFRLNETDFKINGKKILGFSPISEKAYIKIEKNGTLISSSDNKKFQGLKISTFNLPKINIQFTNNTYKFSSFILKKNLMIWVYENKSYQFDVTMFK